MDEFTGDFLGDSQPGLLAHIFSQDYPLDMAIPQDFSAAQDVPLMSAFGMPGLVPGPVSSPPPGLSSSGQQQQMAHQLLTSPSPLSAQQEGNGRPKRAARPVNLRETSGGSVSSSSEEESSWASCSSGAESSSAASVVASSNKGTKKRGGARTRAAARRGTKRRAAARRVSEDDDSSTADESNEKQQGGGKKQQKKKKKKGGRRIELEADLAAKVATGKNLTPEEERKVKKQRRLIKNREAAQQFRRRQKAYIADLESKVDTLGHDNKQFTDKMTVLQNENHLLKQQLDYLRTFLAKAVAVAIPVAPGQSLEQATATGMPMPD